MGTVVSYGGNSLIPAPFITINRNTQKTPVGIDIGSTLSMNLRGSVVQINGDGGLDKIISGQRYIRNTFDRAGKYFQVSCDGTILLEGYPSEINDLSFDTSSDNWIYTAPYSIVLEFNNEPSNVNIAGSGEHIPRLAPPFLSEYDDSWEFEIDDNISKYTLPVSGGTDTNNFTIRATHNISAVGKTEYVGPGLTGSIARQAWQYARDFVITKLNINPQSPLLSGVFNLTGGWTPYNHFRVQRINEAGGSFGINETFVLANGYSIIEEFQAEITSNQEEAFTSVNINGSVQGLESRSYGVNSGDFTITSTKFSNASGFFETIRDSSMIFPRALALGASEGVTLNSIPLTKVITKSPPRGLITYNYGYNNRPSNCITGAKTESISINDENPNDVFARILVLGRAQGPILQSFNTITDFRRTVSIDAIMSPPTGCTLSVLTGTNNPNGQATSILCMFENDLRARYNKVYKERDNTVWEPKNGRYSRSVSWAAVDCTNVPPISLCSGA